MVPAQFIRLVARPISLCHQGQGISFLLLALLRTFAQWQQDITFPAGQQGVFKSVPGQCDALCVYDWNVQAIIYKKKDHYQNLITG